MNLTDIDLSWECPYKTLSGNLPAQISIVLAQFGCLIIGTILTIGIISFERYGEDPQKRHILNQIISQMLGVVLIFYWITTPLNVWRMVVSPVSGVTYWIWWFLATWVIFNHGLLAYESLLIKYLVVAVYKRFLPIQDDFFAMFLMKANFTVAFMVSITNQYTAMAFQMEKRIAGMPTVLATYSKYEPKMITLQCVLTVIATIYVTVRIHLTKQEHKIADDKVDNIKNTKQCNKETISLGLLLICLCMAAPAVIAGVHMDDSDSTQDMESPSLAIYLIGDLGHIVVMEVIIPRFMYINHPDLRRYALRLILEK